MLFSAPDDLQVGFVISCAAVVFLMQAGFCLLESGLVRTKNSINVAVKNLLDCSLTILIYAVLGFSLMFGVSQSGLIGTVNLFDFWSDDKLATFFLFQVVFCSTAATIVSGAVAERIRLRVYLVITLIVSGVVYPIVGHWIWGGVLSGTGSGWLAKLGFVDWAGCVVVHAVGGFAALAAAQSVGARRHLKRTSLTGGHSLTLAILGCFLLWFGWWGFNGGSGLSVDSRLPRVLLNTNFGAVSGIVVAALYSLGARKRIEVNYLISGLIAGLVSVTGACHVLNPITSILAGGCGAMLAIYGEVLIRKVGIDDVVSAFPVHGVAGIWGAAVFAIFAPESSLVAGTRAMQFVVQVGGALAAGLFAYTVVLGLLSLAKRFTRLRVRAAEERLGLNVVEHGATTEVIDLLGAMSLQQQSGNFSKRLEIEEHTEIGQIGRAYNRVLERVELEMDQHEVTNEWLKSERLRLESVLEHAGVGIYQFNEQGVITSANSTLLEIFGKSSLEELLDTPSPTLLPWHSERRDLDETFRQHIQSGTPILELETELQDREGKPLWLLESVVPIRDEAENLICWLGTIHDVTERKQAMIAEVEIAEAKSEAKSAFLANMSHEIRTPLNGVIGMLDLLNNLSLEESPSNYVSIARSSADSLLALVNDILDFSKIEAGRLTLESIEFDLRELIESTAEQFAIRAHQKQLELNCQIAKDLPSAVVGDPERLRQVLINLLGNAVKFTEQGEINLRVSTKDEVIRFSVQDTGIGMSPEVQSKLFESFMQADASTTRQYGGTGLGLAISSQLVHLMDSQIQVFSELGQGTEFWFDVELPQLGSEPAPTATSEDLLQHLPDSRVLVIDDNVTNCAILTGQLNHWGMDVATCQKATQAVERLLVAHRLGKPFELIILDYCMPEMNGRDVARAIRNEPALSSTPIILLSSTYELLTGADLEEAGIQVSLSKPARQTRLLQAITQLLEPSTSQFEKPESRSNGQPLPTLESPTSTLQQADRNQPPHASAASTSPPTQPLIAATSPAIKSTSSLDNQPRGRERVADVLVAEDNQINQMVVQQILKELGHSCELVDNGEKALARMKAGEYGIVLMDGHMPVLDGVAATKAIRGWEKEAQRPETPIIALTANVVQGVRQQCLDAGMNDYLSKPITLEKMAKVTAQYLTRSLEPKERRRETDTAKTTIASAHPTHLNKESASPSQSLDLSQIGVASSETPSITKPSITEPSITEPSITEPSITEPSITEPAISSQQATQQPNHYHPSKELISSTVLAEQFSGDEDFAKQILGVMRDTLPQRINDLSNAHYGSDLAQVRSIAHQMKGAAGDCAMSAIHESAAEVEQYALDQNQQELNVSLQTLKNRVDATLELLEEMLG